MPRVFYHAHLDCFDVPVMDDVGRRPLRLLALDQRELRVGRRHRRPLGPRAGDQAQRGFVPFLVVTHYVLSRGDAIVRTCAAGASRCRCRRDDGGARAADLLGALMWFDFLRTPDGCPGRLSEYGFHTNHAYYNMEYLGFNWFRPPFPARSYSWG